MIYLKILIFLLFHLNTFFPSYVLLLQTVINTCLTKRYIEEILKNYNFHQPISNLSLYRKGILNMVLKFIIKRTLDNMNSKEFKSLLRNLFYSNPFYTKDKYFNHNILVITHKYRGYSFIIRYIIIYIWLCIINVLLLQLYY